MTDINSINMLNSFVVFKIIKVQGKGQIETPGDKGIVFELYEDHPYVGQVIQAPRKVIKEGVLMDCEFKSGDIIWFYNNPPRDRTKVVINGNAYDWCRYHEVLAYQSQTLLSEGDSLTVSDTISVK